MLKVVMFKCGEMIRAEWAYQDFRWVEKNDCLFKLFLLRQM